MYLIGVEPTEKICVNDNENFAVIWIKQLTLYQNPGTQSSLASPDGVFAHLLPDMSVPGWVFVPSQFLMHVTE